MKKNGKFFTNDLAIGLLEKFPPAESGNYKYEPLRGLGHLEMSNKLEKGETVHCSYIKNSLIRHTIYEFDVIASPEYGVITIENITKIK